MSVIGRLDDQVDALIISPIKKRGAQQTEEEATPPQQPAKTTDQARTVDSEKSRAAEGHKHSERESSAPNEIPVWLL
jgi:hypothetical protein